VSFNFVIDVVVSLEYFSAVASILRVPQEKLGWYYVVNCFSKLQVSSDLYGDFVYQNLLTLNQDCWSYFKNVSGVRVF